MDIYEAPLYVVLVILVILVYHFYTENKILNKQIKKMQDVNGNVINFPRVPKSNEYIKRIGAIFIIADLDTQEENYKFVINDDYFDKINKVWNKINTYKESEAIQNPNE